MSDSDARRHTATAVPTTLPLLVAVPYLAGPVERRTPASDHMRATRPATIWSGDPLTSHTHVPSSADGSSSAAN